MDTETRKEYLRLQTELAILKAKVGDLQKACPHDHALVKLDSDTGNWSSSFDSYWVEVRCPECGEFLNYDSELNTEKYMYWSRRR